MRNPEQDILASIKNNPGTEVSKISLADRLAARKEEEMLTKPISTTKPPKPVKSEKKVKPVAGGGIMSFFGKN